MNPACPIKSEGNCEFSRRYKKTLEEKNSVPSKLRIVSSPGSINLGSLEITVSNHFTMYAIRHVLLVSQKGLSWHAWGTEFNLQTEGMCKENTSPLYLQTLGNCNNLFDWGTVLRFCTPELLYGNLSTQVKWPSIQVSLSEAINNSIYGWLHASVLPATNSQRFRSISF